MRDILEELYDGKIHPWEDKAPQDEEYQKILHRVFELETQLEEHLWSEGQEIYEQYADEQAKLMDAWEKKRFSQGFRLGAQIMLAILSNNQA